MKTNWDTIKELVCTTLELDPGERLRFLEESCGSDLALRAEVEQLVSSHTEGQEFFRLLEDDLGTSHLELHSLSIGDLVADRFEIRAFIAQGGSGEVYEAWDREVAERVALKVLQPRWSSDEAAERFRTEVRLARKIQNPHVCRVHDAGKFLRFDGSVVLFLSMEFLDGETLSAWIKRYAPLKPSEALQILRQIAAGLNAAHLNRILHRDLKSANVILVVQPGAFPRAVLTDFGLSVLAESPVNGFIAGTPAYMAPEQVEGKPLTAAADIYALGIIAYEMVTGKFPFQGTTSLELANARLHNAPKSPRSLNPRVTRKWERAILRCLAFDPADRFGTPNDFVASLDRSYRTHILAAASLLSLTVVLWGWSAHQQKLATAPLPGSVILASFDTTASPDKTSAEAFREELSSALASVPGVHVIAQSTPRQLAITPTALSQIRRQFKTSALISGSIRGEPGNEARVSVQLIDTGSSAVLWSGSYKARPQDLPQLEETIVLGCVGGLRVHLLPIQLDALEKRNSRNPEAYHSFLLGQYFATRRNTNDLLEALTDFKRATSLDNTYAEAWAGLSLSYSLLSTRGVIPRDEAYSHADQAADTALKLSPNLSEGLLMKGFIAQHAWWHWNDAEQYLRQGVSLSPGVAIGHHWLAGLLSSRGVHTEALNEARKALELDRLSPSVNSAYGAFLYRARRYPEAVDHLEHLTRQDPSFLNAKLVLAEVYSQIGRTTESIQLAEAVANASHRASYALADLGYYYGRAGKREEALALMNELNTRYTNNSALPSQMALIQNGLGATDATLDWLKKGIELHDDGMPTLGVEPVYDRFRSDPRFKALIKSIGSLK